MGPGWDRTRDPSIDVALWNVSIDVPLWNVSIGVQLWNVSNDVYLQNPNLECLQMKPNDLSSPIGLSNLSHMRAVTAQVSLCKYAVSPALSMLSS